MIALLQEQPISNDLSKTLSLDYRRQVFHEAADAIRNEFQADTWRAFWDTVVIGKPVSSVAESMNRSTGSIYTARSRVMARLKYKVQEIDVSEAESAEDDIRGEQP